MKRRFLPCLLALALLLPLPCLGAERGADFTDVHPDDWFAPYVQICVEEGLLNGTGDGQFSPDGILNGDEALVMAARVLLAANGETEFPKGPDAEGFWEWAGWEEGKRYPFGYSVDETKNYVESWCWDPLFYLAQQAGPEIFGDGGITYRTNRQVFFNALAFAVQKLDLPMINEVQGVPSTRNEEVLRLYRAGILSGTDEYGSFDGPLPLTRAEAAAALARIARPELRLRFALASFPYEGYTLTPLMEIDARSGPVYPVASILYFDKNGQQQGGDLTLDGKLVVDYPEGKIYSSGVYADGDYLRLYAIDDDWNAATWLMDRNGNYAPPSGQYQFLNATGDGHFIASNSWSDGEIGHTAWYLLSPDGSVEAELPETLGSSYNTWNGFNEGVCPWMEEETGLWGYVDIHGDWVIEPVWAGVSSFSGGYCVIYNDKGQHIVMDRNWTPTMPMRVAETSYATFSLPRSSPGREEQGLIYWEDQNGNNGLLSLDGKSSCSLEGITSSPLQYYNGYAIFHSEMESGCYYLDNKAQRITETFDWAGDIGPDGQGFVGLDGMIYRIEFHQ